MIKNFLIILSLLGTPATSAAHDASCEALLIGSFESLTKYALEQKIINVSNIQSLLDSDKPMNPISNSGQSAAAAKVREAFIKMITQIDPTEWSKIQSRLSSVLAQRQKNDQTKDSARRDTQRVLHPELVTELSVHDGLGIDKAEWAKSKPLTLRLYIFKENHGLGFDTTGIQIEQKIVPPKLWNQATERLRQLDSPDLKHAQLDHVFAVADNVYIVLTKDMLEYSSAGSIFLMQDNSISFVVRLSDLNQVKQCVQLKSGHIDCLFLRRHQWSYIRINSLGQTEKIVDLQNTRSGFSPVTRRMTHLPDGTPLVASTSAMDSVEIFKPLESDKPVTILPIQALELNWITISNDEVYLAVNGVGGKYIIEPFSGTLARTMLPKSFPLEDISTIVDESGQGYVASHFQSKIQILRLYSGVEK